MSSASDFVIENGVLKKYVGPGGDVVIPEGGYRYRKRSVCILQDTEDFDNAIRCNLFWRKSI